MNPRPRHYESRTEPVAVRSPLWRDRTVHTEARPISLVRSAELSAEEYRLALARSDWDAACYIAHVGLAWGASMLAVAAIGLAFVVATAQ